MKKKTKLIQITSVFFLLIITPLIALTFSQSLAGMGQDTTKNNNLTLQQLQNKKLLRETEKLEQETLKIKKETENLEQDFWEKHSSLVTTLASLANTITALVAIVGAYFTIYKQIAETHIEKSKQIDERFTSIIQDLGSEKLEIKASATVSLLTFLEPGYEKYHEQVYMIVVANLKLDSKETTINKLLVKTFEQAIDKYLRKDLLTITPEERKFKLDLSGCHLNGITFSNLSLHQANLNHAQLNNATLDNTTLIDTNLQNVDLTYALITESKFNKANLKDAVFSNYQNKSKSDPKTEIIGLNFDEAILISAKMTKVKIVRTNFNSAEMQEVNFNGAELENVKFKKAILNTAFFKGTSFKNVYFSQAILQNANLKGAEFDDITLKSIAQNQNWKQAYFDDEIKQKLEALMPIATT